MNPDLLWQTKVAARLHDPAEKALVLLRDPAGHENGTSRALRRLLGYEQLGATIDPDNDEALAATLFKSGLPVEIYRHVQRADWWAAAADRPQWPMEEITVDTASGQRSFGFARWAQVRWTNQPVLIHPLTGAEADLGSLGTVDIAEVKRRSFEHFSTLLVELGARGDAAPDWKKIALAFWRFGPELVVTGADLADNDQLGALWALLPADTRVPDHSIWDHLDLTSAFAGAFAADPEGDAALLAISIGPVQSFIAAARKLDDLWAGSHLLSRLAFETMKPILDQLGPDAILFPRLRGLAQVDLWLRDEMGLPGKLFDACAWNEGATDANPLFAAALANRFVAVVPAQRATELAQQCQRAAREWLLKTGLRVVEQLLAEAGYTDTPETPAYAQMRQQIAGFPEVYWAAVPFSLIRCRDPEKQRELDPQGLLEAMAPFHGIAAGQNCGFLDSEAWKVLAERLELDEQGKKALFFAPNPGVLYPAVHELAERVLAAAKAIRPFSQQAQQGWRDSLSGEHEWLTTDRAQLALPPGQREHTLWARIAKRRKAWAKKGEHLGALSAIKRLWPTLYAEEVASALGREDIARFSVSTHTMALAHQLDQWLEHGGLAVDGLGPELAGVQPVALPRKLARRYANHPALKDAKRIPGLLDAAVEAEDGERDYERAKRVVEQTLARATDASDARLETYYALLMMDGDRMGAILSGDSATNTAIAYRQSFHPQVRAGFDARAASHAALKRYAEQRRAISPGRHLAISAALNDFSQIVARQVVEEEHLGRLIYAGGDDVLAVLAVADLLGCAQRLREAYSGELPEDAKTDWGELYRNRKRLHCKAGYAWLDGRLMRMMGNTATASTGAVVAHHQAPLGAVLRELRAAEQRAKGEGGRDAFALTVVKRSGGALHLILKWGAPLRALDALIEYLRDEQTSRRAVYHSLDWLKDLPDPRTEPAMLEQLLAYQLERQSGGDVAKSAPLLARTLRELAVQQPDARRWLANFMGVAEFLAREVRSTAPQADTTCPSPSTERA